MIYAVKVAREFMELHACVAPFSGFFPFHNRGIFLGFHAIFLAGNLSIVYEAEKEVKNVSLLHKKGYEK